VFASFLSLTTSLLKHVRISSSEGSLYNRLQLGHGLSSSSLTDPGNAIDPRKVFCSSFQFGRDGKGSAPSPFAAEIRHGLLNEINVVNHKVGKPPGHRLCVHLSAHTGVPGAIVKCRTTAHYLENLPHYPRKNFSVLRS